MNNYRSVSIPAYNEHDFIEKVLLNFLQTSYPNLIEIFVADGGSTDRTQEIVNKIALKDARVKLLDNPLKIQSTGLNLILAAATGDVLLRADAHSDYAPDYIERCVEELVKSAALNVGGAQRFVAKSPFQAGVTLASKSILGSGGAKYRDPQYDGYADTVYLGCFWRQALLEVGGFDTSQMTNEDAILNQKLLNKNERAIYVSSKIRVWYYPRETWKSLWIQYFKYGRGRYLTSTKHSNLQLRGKLPFLTLSLTIFLALLDLFLPNLGIPALEIIVVGICLPFIESLRVGLKYRTSFKTELWRGNDSKFPSFIECWIYCGTTLLTMPIAHFSGYTYQLIKRNFLKVGGW
jgi:succinoglycan biosynthesis protein ExoA